MSKFGYLEGLKVKGDDIAEMTLYSIVLPNGKNPVLIGRHSGESNAAYANKIVKKSVAQQKVVRAGNLTVTMLAENRDDDRKLFPQHVLTGWRHVCGVDGEDVKFSTDECAAFLDAIPDDAFDEVREFFGNPANFRQAVDPDAAVSKGKN